MKQDGLNFKTWCEENDLSYSTLIKFINQDSYEIKRTPVKGKGDNSQYSYFRFLPKLLKALGLNVEYHHTIHYFQTIEGKFE
jgi:hypothetical protein